MVFSSFVLGNWVVTSFSDWLHFTGLWKHSTSFFWTLLSNCTLKISLCVPICLFIQSTNINNRINLISGTEKSKHITYTIVVPVVAALVSILLLVLLAFVYKKQASKQEFVSTSFLKELKFIFCFGCILWLQTYCKMDHLPGACISHHQN